MSLDQNNQIRILRKHHAPHNTELEGSKDPTMEFLDSETSKYPALSEEYQKLADLFQGKLWHQLTKELIVFMTKGGRGRNLIDLYENFIIKFEAKINQLQFVQLIAVVAQQYLPSRPLVESEVNEGIGFLKHIAEKRGRLGEDAYVLVQMSIADLLVQIGSKESLQQAKTLIDQVQVVVSQPAGSDAVVNSSIFRVSCEYYKVTGPADEFYKSAVQYLAYTPLETLSDDTQRRMAVDMSISALVAESVFNYGEVLAQPILESLKQSEMPWLQDLLQIFSSGDIDGFSDLCTRNQQSFESQPALVANLEVLRQKIALLSVMQLVFSLPPDNRIIELSTIASSTRLNTDQAEWLLMRAMSKGLIKGKIDQVEQVVHISWLKPRVLDSEQMSTLNEKLGVWKANVDKTLLFIEAETPELFQ